MRNKAINTMAEYIYIVKASQEESSCKIGITKNLERRLKEYNNMTGNSIDNIFQYLFTCEVEDMRKVENDIKKEFPEFRQKKNKEMYFFNELVIKKYIGFIQGHPLFIQDIFVKTEEPKQVVKIVKKTTPSLEERGLKQIDVINKAKKIKNDEFYTQYEDVEKEIAMYAQNIWKDKCVFCNCDDAVDTDERKTSAFALYFLNNFKKLELKKLICAHYSGGSEIFYQRARGYVFTKEGYSEIIDDYDNMKVEPKSYNGSFDHPISLKILNEEADIVCTNPPFSRAKDYWKLVVESGKKFLIISNITVVKDKAYISYFKDNKVWAGYNRVDWFLNPKKQLTDASGHWYTNIPVINRPKYKQLKVFPLNEIPEKYKQYDDTGTLLVDNCYIPNNYKKPFAVSVRPILNGLLEKGYKIVLDKSYYPYVEGKMKFSRVLVQKV